MSVRESPICDQASLPLMSGGWRVDEPVTSRKPRRRYWPHDFDSDGQVDGSRLWRSAAIHAGRFRSTRIRSLQVLLTPSRRVVVADGIATLTTVPSSRTLTGFAAIGAAAAAATLAGLTLVDPGPIGLSVVVAGLATLLGWLFIFERRLRVWRLWNDHVGAWTLSDVASVPGRGGGRRLMQRVVDMADAANRMVILAVRADNAPAVRLYRRSGFHQIGRRDGMLLFGRDPEPLLRDESADARSGIVSRQARPLIATGVAFVGSGTLVAIYWSTPVAWVMPVAVMVAVQGITFDVAERRVPNWLTGGGFVGVSLAVGLASLFAGVDILGAGFMGAALCALPLLMSHVMTRSRTPGLGDVKLAGVVGLAVGAVHPLAAYVGVVGALLLGAVLGLAWRLRTGSSSFPFAPAIALGLLAVTAMWPAVEGPVTW